MKIGPLSVDEVMSLVMSQVMLCLNFEVSVVNFERRPLTSGSGTGMVFLGVTVCGVTANSISMTMSLLLVVVCCAIWELRLVSNSNCYCY